MAKPNRAKSGSVDFPCQKLDVHVHVATCENPMGMFTVEERIEFDKFYGVDKCVLLTMEAPAGMSVPGMLTPEEAAKIVAEHPDHFVWFCNVNPDGTDATMEKLRKYKEMGAKGVGEFATLKRFDDPIMEHMFACCQELGLPILFHMSPNGLGYGVIDEAGLPLLEGALKKFPKLNFIGHSQPFWFEMSQYPEGLTAEERNIYPKGKVIPGRTPYLLETYPNLYADLSADSGGNALIRDEEYAIEFLNKFQDKVMFGSDVCNTNFIYPLAFYLDSLLHQDKISDEVYIKVCRGNAEKLLGI